MKFQELKQNLKNRIANVYYLYGEDEFLKSNAKQIIWQFVNGLDKLNCIELTTEDCSATKLADTCNTYGFFGKKLVVLKENAGKKDAGLINKIKEFNLQENNCSVLIVIQDEDSAFFDALKQEIVSIDCSRLDETLLIKWIANKVNGRATISYNASKMLIDYCNRFLGKIDVELEKLIAYVGNAEITSEDIDNMVVKDLEYNVFELTENLAKGNKGRAIKIFNDMLEDKKQNTSILPLIGNHFRRLFYVSITKMPIDEISSYLGVKPFAVKKLMEQTVRFSPKTLKEIVEKIESIESGFKTGKLSYELSIKYLFNFILDSVK